MTAGSHTGLSGILSSISVGFASPGLRAGLRIGLLLDYRDSAGPVALWKTARFDWVESSLRVARRSVGPATFVLLLREKI